MSKQKIMARPQTVALALAASMTTASQTSSEHHSRVVATLKQKKLELAEALDSSTVQNASKKVRITRRRVAA